MITQTTWLHSMLGTTSTEHEHPSFCPKHANIKTLGTVDKVQEQIRNLRTSFSETSLDEVKVVQDKYYSHIIRARLESEFFQLEPPFHFTFDDSMFLFLWTIDNLRQEPHQPISDGSINEERVETWRSLLQHAERLYNQFLDVFPYLDQEECKSNIRMIAILISMKFYYCNDEVYDSDFIRAFYLSTTGFEFHKLHEIARMSIEKMEGAGITRYQLRMMEGIFVSAIFRHSKKDSVDDSKQPVAFTTNPARSFGSSSF